MKGIPAPIIAPLTRYFGHTERVHIVIFRDNDKRRLNMETLMAAWPGVEWDGTTLVFSGISYEDLSRNAVEFYEYVVRQGYKRIAARIRHRMGHNGHGWPEEKG